MSPGVFNRFTGTSVSQTVLYFYIFTVKTFFLTAQHICWKFGLLSLLLPLFRQANIEHRPCHVFHSCVRTVASTLFCPPAFTIVSYLSGSISCLNPQIHPFLPSHTHSMSIFLQTWPSTSCVCAKSLQCCPTLLRLCGVWPSRLICPWDSLGKNTRMGCHVLLQGIFPT